ncbi:phage tail family protein [Staphylococcus sp. IVB6238]|uniref:phage tail family protein n=1 Tax=Staphylococcus sp. IVB6238 TaxID=2989770 RepID=UPI0021CED108|nr:phage tail family protein [Staphylococcus sp. IVB6238]UXR73294.1 phage tail family protein [Staphylococcus sp. IVB6238]
MDIEVVTKDNKVFKLSDIGMIATDFIVSSIKHEVYSQSIEGRHGLVDYGADYCDRTITVPFLFYPNELHEFSHGRDELFEYLTGTESFYIRELRRPRRKEYDFVKPLKTELPKWVPQTESEYVNGKQYLVRLSNVVSLDQEESRAKGTLEFTTTVLPFAETRYTTMQLNAQAYDENTDLHGTAENIDFDNTRYVFSSNSFTVFNAGNLTVQPESMYLKITVRGVSASSSFSIKNLTTGKTFTVNKAVNGTLILNGLDVKLNGINILRDTNLTFIDIAPGFNNFEITGGTFSSIEFDFKYYYK